MPRPEPDRSREGVRGTWRQETGGIRWRLRSIPIGRDDEPKPVLLAEDCRHAILHRGSRRSTVGHRQLPGFCRRPFSEVLASAVGRRVRVSGVRSEVGPSELLTWPCARAGRCEGPVCPRRGRPSIPCARPPTDLPKLPPSGSGQPGRLGAEVRRQRRPIRLGAA